MSAGELSRVFVGLTGRAALMCCAGLLSGESRSVRQALGTRAFHNVRARDDQAIVSSGCDPPGLRCPDRASVIFLMLCARTLRAAVKTMVIWVSERFLEIPVPTRNSRGTVGSRRIIISTILKPWYAYCLLIFELFEVFYPLLKSILSPTILTQLITSTLPP